jgi:hypothetical protein
MLHWITIENQNLEKKYSVFDITTIPGVFNVAQSLVAYVMFCRQSLFFFVFFFCWSLYCLSFDLRHAILQLNIRHSRSFFYYNWIDTAAGALLLPKIYLGGCDMLWFLFFNVWYSHFVFQVTILCDLLNKYRFDCKSVVTVNWYYF